MDFFTAAHRVLLVVHRSGANYALAGGLAVGVHGYVRATEDIDLVVPDAAQAELILAALRSDQWVVQTNAILFPNGGILHRAVLALGRDHWVVDIIVAPPGIDLLHDRERSDLDGCACWLIGRDSLIRMKRAAGRPRDLDDLTHLEGRP